MKTPGTVPRMPPGTERCAHKKGAGLRPSRVLLDWDEGFFVDNSNVPGRAAECKRGKPALFGENISRGHGPAASALDSVFRSYLAPVFIAACAVMVMVCLLAGAPLTAIPTTSEEIVKRRSIAARLHRTPAALALYEYLCERAFETGRTTIYTQRQTVADQIGWSCLATVTQALNVLEAEGLIHRRACARTNKDGCAVGKYLRVSLRKSRSSRFWVRSSSEGIIGSKPPSGKDSSYGIIGSDPPSYYYSNSVGVRDAADAGAAATAPPKQPHAATTDESDSADPIPLETVLIDPATTLPIPTAIMLAVNVGDTGELKRLATLLATFPEIQRQAVLARLTPEQQESLKR